MSDPLLNVMKIMLLAGLYLFFVRVLWAVYTELRDPRTRVARRAEARMAPVPAASVLSPAQTIRAEPGRSPGRGGAKTKSDRSSRRAKAGRARSKGGAAVVVGQLIIIEPATMAGVTFALANEITIGRAATCGIHLDDGYVSQVHARVFATNTGFHVEDLGSSNGTTLNGQPIRATTKLAPGDLIRVGATVMEFS